MFVLGTLLQVVTISVYARVLLKKKTGTVPSADKRGAPSAACPVSSGDNSCGVQRERKF